LLVTQPGQLEAELMERGLRVNVDSVARSLLRCPLAEVETVDRVRLVYKSGWQDTGAVPAFLLPNGSMLGNPAEQVVLHGAAGNAAQRCGIAGSLAGWKSGIAARAAGNSLATFFISANFAAALLKVTDEQGGGAHAFGKSKK
jgi:putative DNA primase/helicase